MKIVIFLSFLFTFSINTFAGHNTLSEEEKKAGFQLLFDGKSLDGWDATHADQWIVADGELIADGPKGRGMLYYVGEVGNHSFTQFELRMQVYVTKRANSGIYFLTEPEGLKYPDKVGYEAQIAINHKNKNKTGSLYKIVTLSTSPVKEEEWFDYVIRVEGSVISTILNGKVAVKHDTATGAKKEHGDRLGLQCHDPEIVKFRNIRIKLLK
jgi:hypothetical protein